jgi:hypothetical protein
MPFSRVAKPLAEFKPRSPMPGAALLMASRVPGLHGGRVSFDKKMILRYTNSEQINSPMDNAQ